MKALLRVIKMNSGADGTTLLQRTHKAEKTVDPNAAHRRNIIHGYLSAMPSWHMKTVRQLTQGTIANGPRQEPLARIDEFPRLQYLLLKSPVGKAMTARVKYACRSRRTQ